MPDLAVPMPWRACHPDRDSALTDTTNRPSRLGRAVRLGWTVRSPRSHTKDPDRPVGVMAPSRPLRLGNDVNGRSCVAWRRLDGVPAQRHERALWVALSRDELDFARDQRD